MAIRSIKGKLAAAILSGDGMKGVPSSLAKRARDKLVVLDEAESLDELRHPPGNRLEALRGDRSGQWSIRVNDQWRICFRWENGDAYEAEVVDYH